MLTGFSMRGGARVGSLNVSYPFATLSVENDGLVVPGFGKRVRIPRTEIRGLHRIEEFFSVGLKIKHACVTFPSEVVFGATLLPWGSGYEQLKALLIAAGYSVTD